jgi:hypothetical protein
MASDIQDLVDKWFDLVRAQGTLSADFAKEWFDAVQGLTSNRRVTLRFQVPSNLMGDSGDQNNPHVVVPNGAPGTIQATVGFHNQANNRIQSDKLVVTEDPVGSDKFRFSLKDVGKDGVPAGLYMGPVYDTSGTELKLVADVIIKVV